MSVSEGYQGWLLAGRYRLHAELGRGGMGRVWRGHDELLDRPVAVKEITLGQRPQPEREALLGRTMSEARLAARLSHPHIAAVYDVVVADERPWIVLQLVRAPTLADVLAERGPLPSAAVARIGLQVLEALQAAHTAGIVHRDVKPANILLDDDGRHAVLTDFGLATSLEQPARTSLTETGIVVGTPAYIAPERARGAAPTPPSDLWSLGVTLYTAVEGRCPFERGSALATISAVLTADPAPFEHAGPLAPLITGLLAKDPAHRTGPRDARAHLHRIAVPPIEQLPGTGALAPVAPRETVPAPALPPSQPATASLTGDGPSAAASPAPAAVRLAADPASRRPWATYTRPAAAVTVLIAGVLAATTWPGQPAGPPAAERPLADTAVTSTPTPPTAHLQAQPVSIKRGTPATPHQDERPARASAVTDALPPGQAKKTTGKNGKSGKSGKVTHGHKLRSPSKGGGKGHK
ncbi:protein kinase [Nonomuraea sp. NPDC050643]|uniref:serine/threonine-protein kinase n=1 Tax=Nonomuraea sp. NPDC050643 TaxID=3155660 RepID=UPI0033E817C3